MGIVNVTPDSFSDGGLHGATALAHAERLLKEGAHILDVGAESSRPGAQAVPLDEEVRRLQPVLDELVRWNVPISVDTCKPQVMQAVLDLGVDIINDIWALRQPDALAVVAAHGTCGVCLMHMHGLPQTMQSLPMQGQALPAVQAFLRERIEAWQAQGGGLGRLVLDPGVGFGKTVAQNFELLTSQRELLTLGCPLLLGWSRKSSLGAVTGLAVGDRLIPSVAAALMAAERGARVLRVHDVRATVQALQVFQVVNSGVPPGLS